MVELWLLAALSYAFFHALVSLQDKITLKHKSIDPICFATFRYGWNAVFSLFIVLLFFGFALPSFITFLNIFLLSIIWAIAGVLYFIPMKTGDISQLIPFREIPPVLLSFILAIVLLSESVSVFDFLGTLTIVVGVYVLLTHGKIIVPKISKALLAIGGCGVLLAVFGVFSKPVSLMIHPSLLNFYLYSLVFLMYIFGNSAMNYKNQLITFKKIFDDKKILSLSLGASLSATIGTLSLFYGLTVGKAAEVLPVTRVLPVFVTLLGWLFLKEKAGLPRLIGAIVMFIGVYLIAI